MATVAKSSTDQGGFIGGEWGPASQGRHSDPRYSTALSLSINGFPEEETAWVKRSGTVFIVPALNRAYAKLLTFEGSETCSFAMEFTPFQPNYAIGSSQTYGSLRFITQGGVVCTNDIQTITAFDATTGEITLSGNPSWADGDRVQFVFPDVTSSLYPYPLADMGFLQNRVLVIGNFVAGTNATMLIVEDECGGGIDLSVANNAWFVGAQVLHHRVLATPYTTLAQLQALRAIQAEIDSIILCPSVLPQCVQITTEGTGDSDPVFTINPLDMIDGPYLDPQAETLTISGYSGTITVTASGAAFAATDVGRSMRIFTQPPIYNPVSTYSAGDNVTDANGAWWTAMQAISAGWTPGQPQTINGVATLVWAPAPNAGSWAWGVIATYSSTTVVTVTLDTSIPGMTLQSANGMTAYEWQLGVYSGTTGYPTCGTYYQGRLWFGGCVANRFDTTISNGIPDVIGSNIAIFSPSDPYNNVTDASGMSYTLNTKGLNQIQWMLADAGGVLMGTLADEFLIGASTLGDPITPTSIQDYPRTRYGSINQDVVRAGMAVVFVHKRGRRIMEYLDDAFTSKPSGRHLNENAKHLTVSGCALLAYTEEPVPTVWALMNNGLLAQCTYRRFSRFVQSPPEAAGWAWNVHGGQRVFTSMCAVPGKGGIDERLFTVTNSPPIGMNYGPAISNYYIEVMQPPQEQTDGPFDMWSVDQCPGPGPGNSGYDCGGGNPSSFGFASTFAADSAATTVTPTNPFAGFTAGQSPPWGGTNILGAQQTVYFPGTVTLSSLPNPGADTNQLSLSVWLGTNDVYYQGALFSSPALTFGENNIVSAILGPASEAGSFILGACGNAPGYPFGSPQADVSYTPGTSQWQHLMVSMKGDGSGNITVTAYLNDTQLCHNQTFTGSLAQHGDIWPFSTEPDAIKGFGLAEWCLGGQWVINPAYYITIDSYPSPTQVFKIPPLIQVLGRSPTTGWYSFPPGPTAAQMYKALFQGSSYAIQSTIDTEIGTGGISNVPITPSTGGLSGFQGSVAELWIAQGQYIDWSQSANRLKFHEYDSITETWGPISLGIAGQLPLGSPPWLYCSGGPRNFITNRVTINTSNGTGGTVLTETDTSSGIIDFDTGLGGGLQVSPLSWP